MTPGAYQRGDYEGFRNVLPPGSNGVDSAVDAATFAATGRRPPNWDDQLAMYRDLLYASPGLKPDAIGDYFRDASFGAKPEDIVSTENPLIPWQNRPTFQQVVEVQDHRPR